MTQDDLILCAFRYCLGRATYIVHDMVKHLKDHWNEIDHVYKNMIIKDIGRALDMNRFGHEMDKVEWVDFLDWSYKHEKL